MAIVTSYVNDILVSTDGILPHVYPYFFGLPEMEVPQ